MKDNVKTFKQYLLQKDNKKLLFTASVIGIVYLFILRLLYPVPSFYSDSFTWIGAANTGQPVTFRPVGYSKLLMFLRLFSTSDLPLVLAQYASNILANLFLFFTFTFLFPFKKSFRQILYVLLVVNPFYVFYSNYISADAFFNCCAVIWFTLLIWIMHRPSWPLIIAQLAFLCALFELRYNAIFFPAISTLAVSISKMPAVKKAVSIAVSFALIAAIVIITTYVTKNFTGTKTFSAFSGWQLANNALHVIQHDKIDTSQIKDKKAKDFTAFAVHFFDTARQTFPDSGATAVFMWHINSPLKTYMYTFRQPGWTYFKTWNALGPVYNEFGKTIIRQKPLSYLQHFVVPNVQAYFFPPPEIYQTYMEDKDTIAQIACKYFHYKSNKTAPHHPVVYAAMFMPSLYLFIGVNIIFILACIAYLVLGQYKKQPVLYNQTLLTFTAFYIANFFFVVLLAPSVFRYHIFILTLSFPILLYLLQQTIFNGPTNKAGRQ